MAPKKKRQSLAEKIGSIITEGSKSFGSDDEAEDTKAKVDEYDDESDNVEDFKNEFNRSSIRKRNANLLEEIDDRYKAKKVSKKELFNNGSSDNDDNDEDGDESEEDEDDGSDDDDDYDDIEDSEDSDEQNIQNESDGEEDEESNNSDEDKEEINGNHDEQSNEDESLQNSSDNDDGSDDYDELDESIDISNPLRRDRGPKEGGIKTVSDFNIRAEIEKGNCVRSQLQLWENFLEMRIQLQKCLISSNKMPQYDAYKVYKSNKEFRKSSDLTKDKLSDLLTNLLELQSKLLNKFPETKGILSGTKKGVDKDKNMLEKEVDPMDEEIPSDFEDEINGDENDSNLEDEDENNLLGENVEESNEEEESDSEEENEPAKKKRKLNEFEKIIAENHKAYSAYRDSVIQKWNDKVRVSSGVIKKGPNQPALKQIEFALANKDKLLKKTQMKRSEYEIIGKTTSSTEDNDGRRIQEYDTEIYDDDDFYHQLLRELIEQKSADVTDPIQLSKQWIQLQNLRKKMKRKIDTRATKGRRLRYDVHQKLVNFMAPITVNDTWTDYAKNELYNSLFGKIKTVSQEAVTT